jgi:calmodulin
MPLTESQEQECGEVFLKFAKGGSIGSKELPNACRAAGLNPSEADLALWVQEAKSGFDLPAFKKFMGRKFDETGDSAEEIVDSFRQFDASGSGTIAVTELTHILTSMGEKMTKEEVKVLIDECDVENGRIDYTSLANMLYGASD